MGRNKPDLFRKMGHVTVIQMIENSSEVLLRKK
jgi:hypothetical protein